MKSIYDQEASHFRTNGYVTMDVDWISKETSRELCADLYDELTKGCRKTLHNRLGDWLMWSFVPLFKKYDSHNRNLRVNSVDSHLTPGKGRGDFYKLCSSQKNIQDHFRIICNLNLDDVIINFPYDKVILKPGEIIIVEERMLQYSYHLNDNYVVRILFSISISLKKKTLFPTSCFSLRWFFKTNARRPPSRQWVILLPNNNYYMGNLHM